MTVCDARRSIIALFLAAACARDSDYQREAARANAILQARQDSLQAQYHLDRYAHYDWDQRTRRIVFSDHDVAKVIAHVQFVGSVSTRSNTWLWAWGNESIDTGLTTIARQVRVYGATHHLKRLVEATWPATEADGWEMAAFAVQVSGALGAYRSPSPSGPLFLVFTDMRWATAADTVVHGENESH